MRRALMLIVPLIGLAECATGPSLQSRMAGYIGASGRTLVQQMGVPDKQITEDGVQYLAYTVRHEAEIEPDPASFGPFLGPFGGPFYGPDYGGFYEAGLPQPIDEWSCEATFILKSDHVINFVLRGNDCA